ncbi:hypothetical protein PA598K_05964 [Paenibacillus sp. 598K]|uniref:LytTR family transcriptional regulator DNA-binding domain-containing protein n=1 Tax=Paenibacillus sp. 598K TaxID=1117987 RepID=UPI000FF9D52E|nr:LytTR family transcriptional regulator DNA-binding domain-containing protein [Paenibacillus sp. 598K]GBF77412.1 hypothetical protein PA598K_05964 [Paenibacillus sp. 598K]
MKVPVVRVSHPTPEEVYWLDLSEDVIHISTEAGDIVFQTATEKYRLPTTLDEWACITQSHGFEKSDRTTIVNLSKMIDLDHELRIVHLEGSSEKEQKYATVSRARWHHFVEMFKRRKR